MITIKSNIDEFLKNYQKKIKEFENMLNDLATKLVQRMSDDMKQIINDNVMVWSSDEIGHDETGKMAFHRGKNISFDIEPLTAYSIRVSIGDNLDKHEMTDGELVNPVYFIEFGFGLMGQKNPSYNASKFDWVYNKNLHAKAWSYEGWDGEEHISDGAKGINFMYDTIQKYRKDWKIYLADLLKG
jgi:hypothetical protein